MRSALLPRRGARTTALAIGIPALVLGVLAPIASAQSAHWHSENELLEAGSSIDHIVVIYEENHSFDNLYGGWEGVNGRANATAAKTTQVDQAGAAYTCLKQNDVNLAALPATCTDSAHGFSSAFTNTWFL